MNKVIILIISHKEAFTPYEVISLQQCYKVLGQYDILFVCPQGLNVSAYTNQLGFTPSVHFIDPKWQSTYALFNRLKISPLLYQTFQDYEYILFYEPDAFVFKDKLSYWCNQGYDFIGAPSFEGYHNSTSDSPYGQLLNGGLSLRKISSSIQVLKSLRRIKSRQEYFRNYDRMNWKERLIHFPSMIFSFMVKNRFFHSLNNFDENEDVFWSNYVPKNFQWFKVPLSSEALNFSMEVQPQRMFEDNNKELPFGCHAWWRYDLGFWKPFIEKEGYDLSKRSL